ncbi:MAG: hypothetical protein Q9190_006859 [Brigantiaea leucoxantha]
MAVQDNIDEARSYQNQFHIERILTAELAETHKLTLLWDFANYVFDDSAKKYPELGFSEGKRFERPEDFLEEMGPKGVTFIQYASGSHDPASEPRIIATAGCKPWNNEWKLRERVARMREERKAREKALPDTQKADAGLQASSDGFYTEKHENELLQQLEGLEPMQHADGQEDVPRYEVMTVCVDPQSQKRGLVDPLLNAIVQEVRLQIGAQRKESKFKLVVRTMKEMNEAYWLKKGFRTVAQKVFEPGIFGSPTGFTMLDMTRDHQLEWHHLDRLKSCDHH